MKQRLYGAEKPVSGQSRIVPEHRIFYGVKRYQLKV